MTDQFPAAPAQSGLSDNVAGGLAYLTFIPAIIFLVLEPFNKNPFVKFHSWQCLLLTGVAIAWDILDFILNLFFHRIPGLGLLTGLLLGIVAFVISIGIFILWLIAIINAFQGKKFLIPIIGAIAEKQANS